MDAGREDMNQMIEDEPKTPHFADRNRFFGISLAESAAPGSPRRLDLAMEALDEEGTEGGGDIVARLKRQVTLDRRSMMALYLELDEERSAAAVAANNAMAMITRLHEEKAAVQMEALQYQRMMDEQAEYDQEAMQMMKDMLVKREGELKAMECELEEYRTRYGVIGDASNDLCEVDLDEGRQDVASPEVISSSDSPYEGHQDVANPEVVSSSESPYEDHQAVANPVVVSSSDSTYEGHQDVANPEVVSSSESPYEGHQDVANPEVVSSSESPYEDHQAVANPGVVSSSSDSMYEGHQVVANPMVVSSSDSPYEGHQAVANPGVVSSSDSQIDEERAMLDELAKLDYEGEMIHLIGVLGELEEKMYSVDEMPTSRKEDEERKAVIARQVTLVKERLRAVEAESIFLKNVAKNLHKKGEGVKVLSEISQHLRKQRQKLDVN